MALVIAQKYDLRTAQPKYCAFIMHFCYFDEFIDNALICRWTGWPSRAILS